MNGCDSAFGPTMMQALAAKQAGVTWWGWYAGGPGAFHVWRDDEVAVLAENGITTSLPIWVPRLDLTGDPAADARDTIVRAKHLGWQGVVCLDTEASMRGNPRLISYVTDWCLAVQFVGWTPVVYGGGNFVPAGVHPWWIIPAGFNVPLGHCHQTGHAAFDGLDVDTDQTGFMFPVAAHERQWEISHT